MKKITLSIFMMLCAVFAVAQTNLVVNGDFANGAEGWNVSPADAAVFANGACDINDPKGTTKLSQAVNIPVVGGSDYVLSFEYKGTMSNGSEADFCKLRVWSMFKDGAGANVYLTDDAETDPLRTNNGYMPTAADWTEHTIAFKAPASAAAFVLELRAYKTGNTSLRNIKLVAAADAGLAAPAMSVAGGNFTEAFDLEITAAEGAKIYYTLDGTEPTAASTEYTAAINIAATTTVKAIAVKDSETSSVATAEYVKVEAGDFVVETIEAFIAKADTENDITISGTVTVLYQNGGQIYVADETATILIYDWDHKEAGLVNGDELTGIVARYGEYNGAAQIKDLVTLPEVVKGDKVDPTVVSLSDIKAEMVHEFVKVVEVEIAETVTLDGDKSRSVMAVFGGETFTLRDNFKIATGNTYTAGEKYEVVGFVGLYKDAPQINFTSLVKSGTVDVENNFANEVVVYTQNSEVVVSAEAGAAIQVYSITGACLYNVVAVDATTTIANMPQGMLVVKVGNTAVKVMNK